MFFSEYEYQVCHAIRVTMRMTDSRKGRWPPTSLLEGKHGVGGAILMGGFPIPSVTNWETSMNKNVQSWEEYWRLPKNISLQKSVLSVGSSVFFVHVSAINHLAGSYSDFISGSRPNHCVFQRPRCCPMAVVALPAGAELPVFLGGWRSLRFFPWFFKLLVLPATRIYFE